MSKVITFSRVFPGYHAKKGQPTYFVEKFLTSIYPNDNFYPCKCSNCEFEFMSCVAEGGHAIADTGDYSDPCCPKCFNTDLNNSDFEIEDYYNDVTPKHHTIRAGNRFKKGDYFSPRVWSGRPYNSKQIVIAPDTLITECWDFEISGGEYKINDNVYGSETESCFERFEKIAENDGLNRHDLLEWFKYPNLFEGQIICWNEKISY